MTRVTLRVSTVTPHVGVAVFVTGNCAELGNWSAQASQPLTLLSTTGSTDVWSTNVDVSVTCLEYRYFTASILQSVVSSVENCSCIVAVQSWECGKCPRQLELSESEMKCTEDIYGSCYGISSISRGWLTGQSEICISIHGQAVSLKDNNTSKMGYRVRCEPVYVGSENSAKLCHQHSQFGPVYCARLTDDSLLPQDRMGIGFDGMNDHVIFKAQTCSVDTVAFKFFLYWNSKEGNCSSEDEIGIAYCQIGTTPKADFVHIPIVSSQVQIIGTLKVDAVIVNPVKGCSNASGFSPPNWERPQQSLNIGHRGMGSTFVNGVRSARISENTVLSFKEAAKSGADMVEFDVMLTSNNIPIVFHDFMACLSLDSTDSKEPSPLKVPVSDLTLEQLNKFGATKYQDFGAGHVNKAEEERPFPTLQHCLEVVDSGLGFNIEVKYCMRVCSTGQYEEGVQHFAERNVYVDAILDCVLQHAGDRKILLSCFDPDVCVMMRAKQARYPVVFLSQGESPKYEPFQDPRAVAFDTAVNFANVESLTGVALDAEGVLKDVRLVDLAHSRGLSIFTWGQANNSVETIKLLREYKVDGIIYDRVNEFMRAIEVNPVE